MTEVNEKNRVFLFISKKCFKKKSTVKLFTRRSYFFCFIERKLSSKFQLISCLERDCQHWQLFDSELSFGCFNWAIQDSTTNKYLNEECWQIFNWIWDSCRHFTSLKRKKGGVLSLDFKSTLVFHFTLKIILTNRISKSRLELFDAFILNNCGDIYVARILSICFYCWNSSFFASFWIDKQLQLKIV